MQALERTPDEDHGESLPGGGRRYRLLFAVPYGPRHDNRHGGRVTAQLLEEFVDHHDVAVVYLDHPGAEPMEPELAARCALVRPVPFQRRLSPRWHSRLDVLSSPFTGRPTAMGAVRSTHFAAQLREVTESWLPDVIQIEHDTLGYCAPALAGTEAARILVVHDPGPRAAADQIAVTSGRQQLAHRMDVAAWRRQWARTLPHVDAVVTLTGDDARLVGDRITGPRVVAIPLGIDVPSRAANLSGSASENVAFVGSYSHTPNVDAAQRLVGSILPRVRRHVPGARLTLVGDAPPAQLRAAAGPQDVVTGRVDSVTPYLDQASVIALPIRLGGGMRVKLLEALAAGKAVVASPVAAAGVDTGDAEVLWIADSDEEFTHAITELLRDEPTRRRLAASARRWAADNLSWPSRRARYEELYRDLV
jgi:glycosyltransferase involved in cell wall biosynthesis